MKQSLSCLFFCASILFSQQALADIPTMHLSWTLSDTSGVSQYKLYYSDNDVMSPKTWHQGCGAATVTTPGTFAMTCTNIPINTFPAYIQVTAQLTEGGEISSNIQEIAEDPSGSPAPSAPSIVQGFTLDVPAQGPPPQSDGTVFYWSMNTLPAATITSEVGGVTITKQENAGTSSPGVTGNCLQQTGTRQYYRFPMSVVPADQGTISFWARHDNPPDSGDGTTRYFFRSSNIGQANTIKAYTYKNNMYFYIYDSGGTLHRTYKVADTWNTGTWYHYAFSWNAAAGSMSIKRDGTVLSEISTTPWSSAQPSWGSQDFYIGHIYPLGSFDELSISNN